MVEQNQRRDDQSFDVDIDKVYQSFITEIDNLRSIDDANLTESRCSTFYRLIGLPVCDKENLYSPGMDKPNNNNADLNQTKTNIANNINKNSEMRALFDARENLPREHLAKFSLQDVNSTLLALSSIEVRKFSAVLKNEDPFDTNIDSQSYSIELVNKIYNNVMDTSGLKGTLIIPTRKHFLKPFLVNPFIDNNVKPARNRLAVPFLKDKSETKLNNNDYLKRPYIEKVCRDRFANSGNVNNLGSHTKEIIESIKNNPSISDDTLIKSLNPNNITSEQVQLANYINIIRSMLRKLSEAVNNATDVLAVDSSNKGQAKYNWYPIPNKNGPEKGCTTRELSQQTNDPSNTQRENDIIELQFQEELKSINNKLLQETKVDLGGFVFDNNEITPDANSSDSYGNALVGPIEAGLSARAVLTDLANDALKHIEIIMGEFSGLGLCDILAVCTALWSVDKSVLAGLIDSVALTRMTDDPTLKYTGAVASPAEAIKSFELKVKEVFELMDKMYKDIRSENIR